MERKLECAGGCWNIGVIDRFIEEAEAEETRLSDNPDILVTPGKVECRGLLVGGFCGAEFFKTQYEIIGHRPGSPVGARVSHHTVPGFIELKPDS